MGRGASASTSAARYVVLLTKTGQQLHEARRLEEKAQEGDAVPAPPKAERRGASSAPQSAPKTEDESGRADDGFTVVDEQHGFRMDAPRPERRATSPPQDDEEDDEAVGGEWITPQNITQHKNKALGLVVDESQPELEDKPSGRRRRNKKKGGNLSVACMTGDFAVQNVLLQMGLRLVSVDGVRIERVKSWVLRCHACYKICKDAERKFCPSCGNAALLRTSVTTTAGGHGDAGTMQVHLKPNFQYRNRGTVYALPMPKPGSASGGRPSGQSKNSGVPILREDQLEWQRAVARQKQQRQREERALQRQLEKGQDSLTARYADPDWLPDLLSGTHSQPLGELPAIGLGRKNPNERRRRRR